MAQQPFYTDDPGVSAPFQFHFEFFNEFDRLPLSSRPSLWQNTLNYKLNLGLPGGLEVDLDNPYLVILRAKEGDPRQSLGNGDTNLGVKWNFRREREGRRWPAMSAAMYFEFPTGNRKEQLGSGLVDYWLYGVVQKTLAKRVRLTGNAGVLFAGNTSTGDIGIETSKGKVFTAGMSVIRKCTARLSLGAEVYGAFTSNLALGKAQMQVLAGGKFQLTELASFDFGILGGRFSAAPSVGAQVGISMDFPTLHRPHSAITSLPAVDGRVGGPGYRPR